MSDDERIEKSSGNVFADLGVAEPEEALAKAELARLVRQEIKARRLNQREAAERLAISQPDVSDLMRGRLSRFSMQRLERFLNALDLEIRIQVGPRPLHKERAGITVEHVESFGGTER